MDSLPWWRNAHLYHIYPFSFMDTNDDGLGDLKGITERAHYFKEIGVTAIWLSPIFKSPMADLGYDISDYHLVDPIFGTNDDLVELIDTIKSLADEAYFHQVTGQATRGKGKEIEREMIPRGKKKRARGEIMREKDKEKSRKLCLRVSKKKSNNKKGIKILLDLVPNHTSDEHIWFQKSVEREDPYTDYYVWVDGKTDPETGKKVPPNNWVSNFSGGAWEWNEQRNQFYLHQFMIKQPDLNFRNPLVVNEIDEIILFYLGKGVDGFRVDAIPFLVEAEDLRDNPVNDGVVGDTYTQNQPETYELTQHWSELVYNYSQKDGEERALFIEAYASLNDTVNYYGKGKYSFMMPFNFMLLTQCDHNSRPKDFRDVIMSWVDNIPAGATANWVIGNHDRTRAADLYGKEMVDAMNMLTAMLPGCKVTYYGEEIGMEDTYVRWDQTVDPAARMLGPNNYQKASRDPERSPMQWDDSDNAGFSNSSKTWLPVNPNYWYLNVAAQRKADNSHLKVFQAMADVREDPVLRLGDLKVLVPNDDTLVVIRTYKREWFALIINMGSHTASYTSENLFKENGLDEDSTVIVTSINAGVKFGLNLKKGQTSIRLRPKGAVVVKSSGKHQNTK